MTKKARTARCKEILYKYPEGTPITEPDDFHFLIETFENHENWELKKGCGVKEIFTTRDFEKSQGKYRNFNILRVDGTTTDISYPKAITPPTSKSKIAQVCRALIQDYIEQFRNSLDFGNIYCPLSKEKTVLYRYNTHIDHYDLTFAELVDRFIELRGFDYLASKLNPSVDNEKRRYFIDEELNEAFRKFHLENTNLRAVYWAENLRRRYESL